MWWQEVEAESEVGRREDGEGFDEDVGRGLILEEVGVELVSVHEGTRAVSIVSDKDFVGI